MDGDGHSLPADEVAVRFLLYMEGERSASPRTLEAYERALSQFRQWMDGDAEGDGSGGFPGWEACEPHHFSAWLYEAMNEQLKPATIRLRFAALRSLYNYLMRREGLPVNPLAEVSLPRARQDLPVYLSRSQMDDLLSPPPPLLPQPQPDGRPPLPPAPRAGGQEEPRLAALPRCGDSGALLRLRHPPERARRAQCRCGAARC